MILSVVKVFVPTILAFIVGIALTPTITKYLYKYKLWKKNGRSQAADISNSTFVALHDAKAEVSTPRLGGIIIWLSVVVTIILIWLVSKAFPSELSNKLDFYSRNQTLVPLASLLLGSFLGFLDDMFQIRGGVAGIDNDAIKFRYFKIFLILIIGLVIGLWFYSKLDISSVDIPFWSQNLYLGALFIPFFMMVLLAVFSGGVIDGMDGLAGGVLAIIFAGYSAIAFGNQQIDIAALCGVVSGGILAFLWFNIPPARFYMGETGMMGLLVLLTVVAFLTDTVLLLPIMALPLALTTASDIVQIVGYKYCGKRRIFRIAPLHHHFHALGWSKEKIVMRYWIVSVVCVVAGVVISLIS